MHQLYREGPAIDGEQCDAQLQASQKMRNQFYLFRIFCEYCFVFLHPGGEPCHEGGDQDTADACGGRDFL